MQSKQKYIYVSTNLIREYTRIDCQKLNKFRRKWKIFKEGKRNTKRGIGLGFIVQSKRRERERELTDLQFIEEGHFGDKGFVWGDLGCWFQVGICRRILPAIHTNKQTKRNETKQNKTTFDPLPKMIRFRSIWNDKFTLLISLLFPITTHNCRRTCYAQLQRRWDGSYRFDSARPDKIESGSGTFTRLEANEYIGKDKT